MDDPKALLQAIVLAELRKIRKHADGEFMLDEKQVRALEGLARILRERETPEEPEPGGAVSLEDALAAVAK